jgi:probable rRNA maturation factor
VKKNSSINNVNIVNISKKKYLKIKTIKESVEKALDGEGIENAKVTVILTDDKHIKELNKSYLNHNYITDVISFNLEEGEIDGEIYISIIQAWKQSLDYHVSLTNELQRLAVHGVLHLAGYTDETKELRQMMHEMEDKYLKK